MASGDIETSFPGGTAEIVFVQCTGTLNLDCEDENEAETTFDGTIFVVVADGGASATVETSDGFTVNDLSLDASSVTIPTLDITGTASLSCSDLDGSYVYDGETITIADACEEVCE